MENEIWKYVINCESKYMVSNLGRIKRLFRNNEKIINGTSKNGYRRVRLCKKGKFYFVHRLVAFSFIDNIENKPCINHINGIKDDNRIENLEWCTIAENNRHSFQYLRIKKS